MALEPVARRALGAADLGVGHLLGDFAAQPRRVDVPAHGRDVEPLVRLDQIDRHARAGRIVHAERKAACRIRGFFSLARQDYFNQVFSFTSAVRAIFGRSSGTIERAIAKRFYEVGFGLHGETEGRSRELCGPCGFE